MQSNSHDVRLTERQCLILEAIVKHHIATAQPAASKTLVTRYGLAVSSATVRNEMAQLEEWGYLYQPHASSGRIPSEKAYRYYVDEVLGRSLPSQREKMQRTFQQEVRHRLLAEYREITWDQWESVFRSTCHLLAQISHYIGLVVSGEVGQNVLERLELVSLGEFQILAVLVLKPGMVKHRILSLESRLTSAQLRMVTTLLNERLAGRSLSEIQQYANETGALYALFDGEYREPAVEIMRGAFLHEYEHDVYWDGLRNFVMQTDLGDAERASAFYQTLESREGLAQLLRAEHALEERREGARVLIGSEIPREALDGCSIITATYTVSGHAYGVLGVIGPMRMEYVRVIPLVELTAAMMTDYFENLQ